MAKNRYLTAANGEIANTIFVENYTLEFWYHKLCVLDYVLDHGEEMLTDIEGIPTGIGGEPNEAESNTGIKNYAKAEYLYTCYHMTEALFTLIKAVEKRGIFWVDVKETGTGSLAKYAEEKFIDNSPSHDEMLDIFYIVESMMEAEDQETTDKKLEKSTEFISEYLKGLANIFSDRGIYNDYKHGLRVSTGKVARNLDDPCSVERKTASGWGQ